MIEPFESVPHDLARLYTLLKTTRDLIKQEESVGNLKKSLSPDQFEICGGKRKREDQTYSIYRQHVKALRFLRKLLSDPVAIKKTDVRFAQNGLQELDDSWDKSDDENIDDLDGDVEQEEDEEEGEEEGEEEEEEEEEVDDGDASYHEKSDDNPEDDDDDDDDDDDASYKGSEKSDASDSDKGSDKEASENEASDASEAD